MQNVIKGYKWFAFILVAVIIWGVGAPELLGEEVREIGKAAQERMTQAIGEAKEIQPEQLNNLVAWIPKLVILLIVLAFVLAGLAAKLVDFNPFRNVKANTVNASLMVVFGLLFGVLVVYEMIYHAPLTLPGASSKHGREIDILYYITLVITGLVFVVMQILIFTFAYRNRYREGRQALFYPENHKLELLWTIIPAVGLACMIIPGLKFWYDINHPDFSKEKPLTIEVVGEQFQWRFRYPGKDGKLGRHAFKLISDTNPVGVDSSDVASKDDFTPTQKEIHLPVNKPVLFQIRAKDVLHGVYLPHFRVNMYAVPGMPTQFAFIPEVTTEEMRVRLNNPNFNYEMLCSQLCGAAHYNMRVVVVVESEEKYKKWLASQQPEVPTNSITEAKDRNNNTNINNATQL
ncbi:MAG: cytochrome c oxidase subunit II [Bacteroidia bacterium]|nr:cytochrome c oxidase subunit II [Bacteroidia bacterium]